MAIDKWNPMGDLIALQDRMNNLLKDTLAAANVANDQRGLSWSPAIDFFETDEAFVIVAELPGLTTQDVDLKVEDHIVSLTAERKPEETKHTYYRRERSNGVFSRSFTLPSPVEAGKIDAQLKFGVLEITLPKKSSRADSKPLQVSIHG